MEIFGKVVSLLVLYPFLALCDCAVPFSEKAAFHAWGSIRAYLLMCLTYLNTTNADGRKTLYMSFISGPI
jgi:hypothetical protein